MNNKKSILILELVNSHYESKLKSIKVLIYRHVVMGLRNFNSLSNKIPLRI